MTLTKFTILASMIAVLIGCAKPTDEEYMQRGADAQKINKPEDAIEAYQGLLETYPQSPKVPEAMYALAALYQNDKHDLLKAIELYKSVVQRFPDHPVASSSSFLIGFVYNNELKDTVAARAAYTEYLNKYPNSPMVSSAQFELQTLGKDPTEILKEQTPIAEKAPVKGTKRK